MWLSFMFNVSAIVGGDDHYQILPRNSKVVQSVQV